MKFTYEFYMDDIVAFLQLAAEKDPDLLGRNLNKAEIRNIVTDTFRLYGRNSLIGWNDDLSDVESGEIAGWAYAQARRYKY